MHERKKEVKEREMLDRESQRDRERERDRYGVQGVTSFTALVDKDGGKVAIQINKKGHFYVRVSICTCSVRHDLLVWPCRLTASPCASKPIADSV